MKSVPARALSLLAACLALLLGGCLDYDEEMWLEGDLSGHAVLTFSIPDQPLITDEISKRINEDSIRQNLEKVPGVKMEKFESFHDSGKFGARISIRFDSVEKLSSFSVSPSDAAPVAPFGTITVRRENGHVFLERTLATLPEMKGKGAVAQKFLGVLLGSNFLDYKLHLPGEPVTSNSGHVSASDHLVEWKFTLGQALREPTVMRVEWKNSSHWKMIAVIIIAIVGAGLFAATRARKTS
ncbi:MAG TPA: hypothetical protein VGH90_11915 [Chthoniobacteraceae bacterium]|jgi:hypothetical protein